MISIISNGNCATTAHSTKKQVAEAFRAYNNNEIKRILLPSPVLTYLMVCALHNVNIPQCCIMH